MEIPGISTQSSSFSTSDPSTTELDQNAFMNLLVTQMQNQDPLSPVQNEDFVAQLATFSSLSELESLNENILAMTTLNQSNALLSQLTQGSSLIGNDVNWTDPFTGESRQGTVDTVRANLEGAKYTLAVNKAAADLGISSFPDQLGSEPPARSRNPCSPLPREGPRRSLPLGCSPA